jgi:DNA-binding transcriptional ArsR family regulator
MTETLPTTPELDHHRGDLIDRIGLFVVARELSIFGDAMRLSIMCYLASQPSAPVKAIREAVGGSQSAASYHLSLLLQAGAVKYERVGQENHYRLVPGRIREIVGQLNLLTTTE